MSTPAKHPDFQPKDLADVSRLADGTLDPARREEVQARIDASPELTALYRRERGLVTILHEARATGRASDALRARIEAERPSPRVRARRRFSYGSGLAGALAAVILALVLILPSGSPGPSISQAVALGALPASTPAPAPDPSAPAAKLGQNVGDVYFPNWAKTFGWQASGQRFDKIGSRGATTVYYREDGHQIAYTIVAAPALAAPSSHADTIAGEQYRTLTLHGRTVVTWRRDNHTCVLSGTNVPASMLQRLAAWEAPGLGSGS